MECAPRSRVNTFRQNTTGVLSTWDFEGEVANGTADIWRFPSAGSLPEHQPWRRVRITTPATKDITAANQTSFTLSGTCTVDGTNILNLIGDATGTIDCSGGLWTVNLNLSAQAAGPVMIGLQYTDYPPDLMSLYKMD
jgi:hypothetical protein